MNGPRDFLWKLTIKGGVEHDLRELLGQDLLSDLRACIRCKEQMTALAQQMNSNSAVKNILLYAVGELNQVSNNADADHRELEKVVAAMALESVSAKIAADSGHAIVGKEIAPFLPQLASDAKLRKNEMLVSPEYMPLVERLLTRRLKGKRQPKISGREKVECPVARPSSTECSMLSEQEREDIRREFWGKDLTLDAKQSSKQKKRKDLEDKLFRFPMEELEAVSLLSFQSRKTKSTGIGAKYKFKVNMIPILMASRGENGGSSMAGFEADQERNEIPLDGSHRDQLPVSQNACAMSEISFSLSPTIFEECANKLHREYHTAITGQELRGLFLTCVDSNSKAASSELGSECMSFDGIASDGMETRDDIDCCLLKIIEKLETGTIPRIRSLENFTKHWSDSIQAFRKDVIVPYLNLAPVDMKYEGNKIPKEAAIEVQSALSERIEHCLTEKVLLRVFMSRMGVMTDSYRSVTKVIIKSAVRELKPVLKSACAVEKYNGTWTMAHMKGALASRAMRALENAVTPMLKEVWSSSSSSMTPSTIQSHSAKGKQFRSNRIRQKDSQIFAPRINTTSYQEEKMKTFRLKR